MDGFNENVEPNEKEASLINKVLERATPAGDRVKGSFMCWWRPQVFCHKVKCMFAWCTKCYDKMEENRDGRPNTNGGRRKRTHVKESTTEVIHDLRGNYEGTHTMEDMTYLVWNTNTRDLKRNKRKQGVKEWPLVVDTCWRCGNEF